MHADASFFANIINVVNEAEEEYRSFIYALRFLSTYFCLSKQWLSTLDVKNITIDNYRDYQGEVNILLMPTDVSSAVNESQPFFPILLVEQKSNHCYVLYRGWGSNKLIAANANFDHLSTHTLSSLKFDQAYICTPVGLSIDTTVAKLFKNTFKFMRRHYFLMLLLGCVTAFSSLFPMFVSSYVFSYLQAMHGKGLLMAIISFSMLIAMAAALNLFNDINIKNANLKLLLVVLPGVFYHLLALPIHTAQSGDLSQKITDYESALCKILSGLLQLLFGLLALILLFLYMLHCQWQLALIFLFISSISLCIKFYLVPKNLHYIENSLTQQGRLFQFTHELLLQIHKIRSGGIEWIVYKRWLNHLLSIKIWSEKSMRIELIALLTQSCMPILLMMSIYLTIYSLSDQYDVFALLQFMICASQFIALFDKSSTQAVDFINLLPSLRRIEPFLSKRIEKYDYSKAINQPLEGDIEFQQINLTDQATGKLILQNISLHIPAGKFVAIVGHSGAGKSSLFKLLLGFEQPDSGSILMDGKPLSSCNIRDIRKQLGVVMQDSNILPGTIFSNLSVQTNLTHDDAWHLTRLVGLDKDIEAMPMKMYTYVSDNAGESLSGGQKQKILIARALASNPRILLLDEATSALDNISQSLIFENLQELGITRIVIAHRYSTIAHADVIYKIEQGRIICHER